jgi:hypothetical protein
VDEGVIPIPETYAGVIVDADETVTFLGPLTSIIL